MLKGRISLEPQVGLRGSAAGGESGCFQVEVQGPLACASHCRGQLAGLGPSGLVRSLHAVRTGVGPSLFSVPGKQCNEAGSLCYTLSSVSSFF